MQPLESVRKAIFEVVSIATTTGFATADFAQWPVMLPFLLFVAAFSGGCAGSTGGGMKVIRILLILKQGSREITRLIHPNAVITGEARQDSLSLTAFWRPCGAFSRSTLSYS